MHTVSHLVAVIFLFLVLILTTWPKSSTQSLKVLLFRLCYKFSIVVRLVQPFETQLGELVVYLSFLSTLHHALKLLLAFLSLQIVLDKRVFDGRLTVVFV